MTRGPTLRPFAPARAARAINNRIDHDPRRRAGR